MLVSSLQPPQGVDELTRQLGERWKMLGADDQAGLIARRLRARRAGALTDFAIEHGERGLRSIGGRRAAASLLEEQDPGLGVSELVERLGQRAGSAT